MEKQLTHMPVVRDSLVRVHRRQFVIGPRCFKARADWQAYEIIAGAARDGDSQVLVLSADPELRVGRATDASGAIWFLLGLAVDTRADYDAPLEEIAQRTSAEVPELYQGWAGRWVLIGNGCLHPDGAAMLGCYYGKNAAGDVWASSSPTLIQKVLEIDEARSKKGHIHWQPAAKTTIKGISWYPPPHSCTPGVFRLLPSQVLKLGSGECQPRPLVSTMTESYSDESLCERIADAIATTVQRLADINAPQEPTLLLSGGRDSRLLLSVVASEKISVNTYTRIHRRAMLADRLLPQKLARAAGYPHRQHYQRKEIPGRRDAILAHAGYNVAWLSSEEFLRGGSDPLTGIVLAGFCGELGRDRMLPVTIASEATGALIANHFDSFSDDTTDQQTLIEAFDAWLAVRKKDTDDCLDLCDYFFLEQRTAGRKGVKEQIFDLFPAERVAPLNSARIFTLIAHLSTKSKREALWISDIIQTSAPELMEHPMNPPERYFGLLPYLILNNRLYKMQRGLLH